MSAGDTKKNEKKKAAFEAVLLSTLEDRALRGEAAKEMIAKLESHDDSKHFQSKYWLTAHESTERKHSTGDFVTIASARKLADAAFEDGKAESNGGEKEDADGISTTWSVGIVGCVVGFAAGLSVGVVGTLGFIYWPRTGK